MSGSYMGKVLWVNLTERKIEEAAVDERIYKDFLSGYGLGARMLFEKIPIGAEPLSHENILGFCTGLLTATPAFFAGRFMVVGKSPLTGGWGDANCGGHLSPEIKRSGFDAIFFTGASKSPVYLMLQDGRASIREAGHLWGLDTVETEKKLKEEVGSKFQVACIGPAGERLSLISGIVNEGGRIAARSGLGAVMGSKKLKAVVAKGGQNVPLHDRDRMVSLNKKFLAAFEGGKFLDRPFLGRFLHFGGKAVRTMRTVPRNDALAYKASLRRYGTCGFTAYCAETGDSPVRNWRGTGYHDFPLATKSWKISDERVIAFEKKKYKCAQCPLGCGGIVENAAGDYAVAGESHKPEYETLGALGTLCLNDNLPAIIKMNDTCNRAGIDTISTGGTIAFAMDCFDRGILTKSDLDGIELKWGDADAMIKLLDKMIRREGIGDVLADGVKKASRTIGKGSEEFAIHAGGQEIPMHDSRFDPGFATAYEVEPTPGRHTIMSFTWLDLMELHRQLKMAKKMPMLRSRAERYNPNNKGDILSLQSKFVQVINGCGFCMFGFKIGGSLPVFPYIEAATGWGRPPEEYMECGERIEQVRHAFNVREGIKPSDFKMTPIARGEPPLDKGPLAGVKLDMDTMDRDFYRCYEWDFQTGMPSRERLQKLGLGFVEKELFGGAAGIGKD